MTNSTISGNTAVVRGGGVYNLRGDVTVINSTIAFNSTGTDGGGVFSDGQNVFYSTIIANNLPGGDCSGNVHTLQNDLVSDETCDLTTPTLPNTDPLLGPLQDNGGPTFTHALLPGSPAIDAISVAQCAITTDQRGVARPQGAACDMGAYEFNPNAGGSITVDTTNDEFNSDGDCSLREAIQAANDDATVDACGAGSGDDTINLPTGTYLLAIAGTGEDNNATGDFDISESLTLVGANGVVIDGNGFDRVFHIRTSANVAISSLTVTGGNAGADNGGGILIDSSATLTASNVTVSGNSAKWGGGIAATGDLTFIQGRIGNNTATFGGGGAYLYGASSSTIRSSLVDNNTSTFGGGLNPWGVSTTLAISNSTLSGNQATSSASSSGGAIFPVLGTVSIDHSTIASNSSSGFGGGIYNESASVTLRNTLIGDNTAPTATDCGGSQLTSAGFNLVEVGCSMGGDLSGNIIGVDGGLGPLQLNSLPLPTHALLGGSPAIDAGSCTDTASDVVIADQRGVSRPQIGTCDIGAYEATGGALGIPGVSSLGLIALGVVMAVFAWMRLRPLPTRRPAPLGG